MWKASDQNTLSSFTNLLLKLLHISHGVCAPSCSGQAAIHLCTGTIALQMLGEVVDPVEVMAAMRTEHYTENRKD